MRFASLASPAIFPGFLDAFAIIRLSRPMATPHQAKPYSTPALFLLLSAIALFQASTKPRHISNISYTSPRLLIFERKCIVSALRGGQSVALPPRGQNPDTSVTHEEAFSGEKPFPYDKPLVGENSDSEVKIPPWRPGLPSWADIKNMPPKEAMQVLKNLQREQKGLPPENLTREEVKMIDEESPKLEAFAQAWKETQEKKKRKKKLKEERIIEQLAKAITHESIPNTTGFQIHEPSQECYLKDDKDSGDKQLKLAIKKQSALTKPELSNTEIEDLRDFRDKALDKAYVYYCRALGRQSVKNKTLYGICHSNRALVSLLKGNLRKCVGDSRQAIEILEQELKTCKISDSLKAIISKAAARGASALKEMDDLDAAEDLLATGLRYLPPGNDKILSDLQSIESKIKNERERIEASRQKFLELARAVSSRNITLRPPSSSITGSHKPCIADPSTLKVPSDSPVLLWPAIMLYPAERQFDFVEVWDERKTLGEQLEEALGDPQNRPAWDKNQLYTPENVDVFYEEMDLKRSNEMNEGMGGLDEFELAERFATGWDDEEGESGGNPTKYSAISRGVTLLEVLKHPRYVTRWVPIFYILARGTELHREFVEGRHDSRSFFDSR